MENFVTAVNCMDGRVQLPVLEAVRSMFDVAYVDSITEAGIVKYLSDKTESEQTKSILERVAISVEKHGSRAIAVAAHSDCAGNFVDNETQKAQLHQAVEFLRAQFPTCKVIGLWVGSDWTPRCIVKEIKT